MRDNKRVTDDDRSSRNPWRFLRRWAVLATVVALVPTLSCFAGSVTLEWDANTEADLAGYRLYYGRATGDYETSIDVGNQTRATVPDLAEGVLYYFVVTAYNSSAQESPLSNEVSYLVAAPNQPPTVSMTVPADGSFYSAPANIGLSATAADPDGTVVGVEFFNGATKIGESFAAPYSMTWNGVLTGTYQLHAVAKDNRGQTTASAPVSVTVINPNQAPTVSFITPTPGALFTAPASISMHAIAADLDGSVVRVEFFQGTTKLGEDATSPYEFTWTDVPAGNYELRAVAVDNLGLTTAGAAVGVMVINPNQAPLVSLDSPAAGARFTAPASISMQATAADLDGSVVRVEFFQGTTKLAEDATSPYEFTWVNVPAGTYNIAAVAVDDDGVSTWSAPVVISVSPNQAPVAVIVSPSDGTAFTSPGTLMITATANDNDGTVTSVEFFAGTTKLGASTSAPYAFSWINPPSGTHSLTAVAIDDSGAAGTSAAVMVSVNSAPTVTLSASGSLFEEGATVRLTAVVSDPDGSIRRVEFHAGSIYLGKDGRAPYEQAWRNVRPGTYEVTAVAYDNQGASTRSDPIVIQVNGGSAEAMYSTELPSLKPIGRDEEGSFELLLSGTPGQIYDVWASNNAEQWEFLISAWNSEGTVIVSDQQAAGVRQRFYRASLHTPQ